MRERAANLLGSDNFYERCVNKLFEYIVLFATCCSLFATQKSDNEAFSRNSFTKKSIKQL